MVFFFFFLSAVDIYFSRAYLPLSVLTPLYKGGTDPILLIDCAEGVSGEWVTLLVEWSSTSQWDCKSLRWAPTRGGSSAWGSAPLRGDSTGYESVNSSLEEQGLHG
ncbi:hypothetical protein CAAN4_E14796 [[Candida] anglica]|uniref:Secreted protein n=1 Tax=[Candida] anglica TaxID=148631 RepID=A0ABP0EFC6_9ASCO